MIRNIDNPRTKVIGVKLVKKVVENIAMWTSRHTEDVHGSSPGSKSQFWNQRSHCH